jgi:electron transfer flavoprotein beta subunit
MKIDLEETIEALDIAEFVQKTMSWRKEEMDMIVCVKQIPDPEIPPARFRIDPVAKQAIPPEGVAPIINPYDERAVELALRVKQKQAGKITVLTVGKTRSETVVKHALSMGADDGIILSDQAFEGSDSFGTAYILTQAIQKVGSYDLILCGRQAADWDEGLVGPIIAETLSLPLVTLAVAIDVAGKELNVKRVTLDGYQVFAVPTPAVVTVSQEVGRPRLPSGRGIIMAARKQVPVWGSKEIGADPSLMGSKAARRKVVNLYVPERERKCEIIKGETPGETGAKLAERLREAGAI